MPSGGTRPGAGRPPRREKHARPVARAEKHIADRLPTLIDNLFKLANGGFEVGSDTLEPAGSIMLGTGENQTLAFPDLDPETLVVVRRTRSIAVPDRAANIYLVDRILGKPTERQELSGPDGGPIEVDDLSDDERARRVASLLDVARARAAGQTATGSESE